MAMMSETDLEKFISSLSHCLISSVASNNPFNSPLMNTGVSKTENILLSENNQYIIRLLYHSNKRQKLRFEVCFIVKSILEMILLLFRGCLKMYDS
jgi:hypothetical protein